MRARAGKQPDWSTGPISSGASHSPGPPQYARSPALDSVLPHLPFGERRMSPELQGLARCPPSPPKLCLMAQRGALWRCRAEALGFHDHSSLPQ